VSPVRKGWKKVLLVPVSIAFVRIAEIIDYVAIQSEPKRKESHWAGFQLHFRHATTHYGRRDVCTLCQAPGAGEATSLSEDMSDTEDGERSLVTRVGFEGALNRSLIKSADVLTMVLLGANGRALTVAIHSQAAGYCRHGQAGIAHGIGFSLDSEERSY
jgi:hypothetical protein